jgi:hypothetical protein
MAVVTAAITLERLAPAGERIARATGAFAVGIGFLMIGTSLTFDGNGDRAPTMGFQDAFCSPHNPRNLNPIFQRYLSHKP